MGILHPYYIYITFCTFDNSQPWWNAGFIRLQITLQHRESWIKNTKKRGGDFEVVWWATSRTCNTRHRRRKGGGVGTRLLHRCIPPWPRLPLRSNRAGLSLSQEWHAHTCRRRMARARNDCRIDISHTLCQGEFDTWIWWHLRHYTNAKNKCKNAI